VADGDSRKGPGRFGAPFDAPVILSDVPGSFTWKVLHDRHPALIQKVRDATPYDPERLRALDLLLGEITEGVIRPLEGAMHDRDLWESWDRGHIGERWDDAPFLWAESYFYRKLLAAVGYFDPGPWQGIDPFEPFKQAELFGEAVDDELRALDGSPALGVEERDQALILRALWGNRADLVFRISAGGSGLAAQVPGLVADDSALIWSMIDGLSAAGGSLAGGDPMVGGALAGADSTVGGGLVGGDATVGGALTADGRSSRICLVADNAGSELLPDLVLIDHLLHARGVGEVVLHVKPSPYYVSDAMMTDVVACLRRMSAAGGQAGEVGSRLREAMGSGRLLVRAHVFACAPLPYSEMPDDLRKDFASASLTIMKGDLNYRRLVGDRDWPPTTPFAEVTGYFPGPVAALRTLKSEVVVGLGAETVTALETSGQPWRVSGTHGLIQARS
jgi:hypothetical protein